MTTPVRQRIFSFDLLRAFAIVCVVIVHVNGNSWFVLELSPLIKIFSLFFSSVGYLGVPIFVTISGALILPKHRHLIRFFIRRFIRIVPPWVFYTALTVLSYNYLYWLSDQTIVTSNIKHIMYGTYGFVPLIIGLYLITPLIQIILDASATNLSKFIFIWFIFSSLLPALSIFSPQLDLNVPRYLSLQYLGYYLAGYQIIKTPSLNNKLLTTSTAAFFLASTYLVFLAHRYNASISHFLYLNPFSFMTTISLVKLCHQSNLKKLLSKSILQIIKLISSTSFGIYLVHPIFQNLLKFSLFDQQFTGLHLPYPVSTIFNLFILLLLSSTFVYTISKLAPLRYFSGR